MTFIRASNEYATIEAELIDKVTTVCKNIVANIKNNPTQTRENYWNALVKYWGDRGGDYINAINEAAKSLPKA